MPEIRFYHMTRSSLEQALPVMLDRTLGRAQRAVVMAPTQERIASLDAHLWTFSADAFLPHGTAADGSAPDQPIWLTTTPENPNGAKVLFLCDGALPEDDGALADFELVALLFDGRDDAMVQAARERWKRWKAAGNPLTYWQQGEAGWEQNAQS